MVYTVPHHKELLNNNKRVRMKKELTKIENQIAQARTDLSVVEAKMKECIKLHAEYIDLLGKKSTGAKGLAMQINIRIKKEFETDRDHMSLDEMLLLKSLLAKIDAVISESEANKISRKGIKLKVYSTIEKYGELVRGVK